VTQPIEVLLVTSQGCHYCDHTLAVLHEVGETTPLSVTTIALTSERGMDLLVRHRVPYPPILLIEGQFFGYGRISRRKLEMHLARIANSDLVS
jgi:hypothetical protein